MSFVENNGEKNMNCRKQLSCGKRVCRTRAKQVHAQNIGLLIRHLSLQTPVTSNG